MFEVEVLGVCFVWVRVCVRMPLHVVTQFTQLGRLDSSNREGEASQGQGRAAGLGPGQAVLVVLEIQVGLCWELIVEH